MAQDFEHIENPYDNFLQRGEPDVGNGNVETMPVKSDGSMGDVWINNFLKSSNWNPRSVGFYIDGQTGYAEFTNIYASGTITATSGTIGGWTISSSELSSGNVKLQSTAQRILLGSATAPLTGAGIFIGFDDPDYEFRTGDPAGAYMHWDGSALSIVGGTITSGTIQTASSGTRFVMSNATQRYDTLNANGDVVATMNWSSTSAAVLKLAPTHDARRALEFVIPASFAGAGTEADAKAITIDNAADSICIDITDGGLIGLKVVGCTQESILITSTSTTNSAISVTHSGDSNPAIDITATLSDDSGIEISCTPVNTSTAGIVITLGSTSTGSGIRIIDPATSVVSTSVGIFIDRDANSASDAYGMSVDVANAGAGASIGVNLAFSGMHAFAVTADATAEGSYAGRFPIRVSGATRYVSYHNA